MLTLVPTVFGCVSVTVVSFVFKQGRLLCACGVLSLLSLYTQLVTPTLALFPYVTMAVGLALLLDGATQSRTDLWSWVGGCGLAATTAYLLHVYPFQWWRTLPFHACIVFVWCVVTVLWPGCSAHKREVLAVAGVTWPLMWSVCSYNGVVITLQATEIVSWLNGFWLSCGLLSCVDGCQTMWNRAMHLRAGHFSR